MQDFHDENDVRVSPLGATVREYESANSMLPLAILVTLLVLGFDSYFFLLAANISTAGFVAAVLVALLCAALLTFFVYAWVRVMRWLPTVFEQCYELRYRDGRPVPVPAEIVQCPYDVYSGANRRAEWELLVTDSDSARSNIVLHVVYSDRLGNHLFQYSFARLRAMYLDVAFQSTQLPSPFRAVRTEVERARSTGNSSGPAALPARHSALLRPRGCCASMSNVPSFSACSTCGTSRKTHDALLRPKWHAAWRGLLLEPSCRYSMNTRAWAGHECEIAQWFLPSVRAAREEILTQATITTNSARLKEEHAALSAVCAETKSNEGRGEVMVHVRVGDILWGHHGAYRPLPMSFYKNALETIEAFERDDDNDDAGASAVAPRTLVLVTEDASSSLIKRMRAAFEKWGWSVRLQSCSVRADLLTLMESKRALIGSVSSFAWWAAFLGHARVVVMPQWGVLMPHSWRPSVRFPVHLLHDMTIPSISGGNVAASREEKREGDETIAALLEDKTRGIEHESESDSESEGQRRIIAVPLKHLKRWAGNTHKAEDELFDC
jgi:hypothetical protein